MFHSVCVVCECVFACVYLHVWCSDTKTTHQHATQIIHTKLSRAINNFNWHHKNWTRNTICIEIKCGCVNMCWRLWMCCGYLTSNNLLGLRTNHNNMHEHSNSQPILSIIKINPYQETTIIIYSFSHCVYFSELPNTSSKMINQTNNAHKLQRPSMERHKIILKPTMSAKNFTQSVWHGNLAIIRL